MSAGAEQPSRPADQTGYFSDWLVDYLADHGLERYVFNPGASFRGVHDSLTTAESTLGRRLITMACHEEIAVAIAHGYYKASHEHLVVMLHANVGLLHATMALFNAWCDRVPVLCLVGNGPLEAGLRRPWIDWIHTAHDVLAPVRGYTAMAASPLGQWGTAEEVRRAVGALQSDRLQGPAVISLDVSTQEAPAVDLGAVAPPTKTRVATRVADRDIEDLATLLAGARRPVVVVERAGRYDGAMDALRALRTSYGDGLPVVEYGYYENAISTAEPGFLRLEDASAASDLPPDLVLAVAATDPVGQLSRVFPGLPGAAVSVVSVEQHLPSLGGWSADAVIDPPGVLIVGDLVDALLRIAALLDASSAPQHQHPVVAAAASSGPTARPVGPLDRLVQVLLGAAHGRELTIVNGGSTAIDQAIRHNVPFSRERQHLGMNGGGGLGYGLPASIGAAMALRATNPDQTALAFLGDGDFLYTPSALWTAAAEKVPLLIVVVNNGQYGNSVDHARVVAADRGRGTDPRRATTFDEHAVDFVRIAGGFGIGAARAVLGEPGLDDTLDLAYKTVAAGRPFLVDVVVDD